MLYSWSYFGYNNCAFIIFPHISYAIIILSTKNICMIWLSILFCLEYILDHLFLVMTLCFTLNKIFWFGSLSGLSPTIISGLIAFIFRHHSFEITYTPKRVLRLLFLVTISCSFHFTTTSLFILLFSHDWPRLMNSDTILFQIAINVQYVCCMAFCIWPLTTKTIFFTYWLFLLPCRFFTFLRSTIKISHINGHSRVLHI